MISRRTETRRCLFNSDGDSKRGIGLVWGRTSRSALRAAVVLFFSFTLLGCAKREARPIFPDLQPPIHWPAAPAAPRVRYVGSLRSAADLRPVRKTWKRLGELLVGKKEPEKLYGPRAVVCTHDGQRVWIADPGGRCLHLFDLQRREYKKIQRIGGSPLLSPVGLCLGSGESIYLCDSEALAIHRLSSRDGAWIETLRLPDELLRPAAVFYDDAKQVLWVVDVLGHDLKVLDPDGSLLKIVGRRGTKPGEFNFPCDLAMGNGVLWIADAGNHRVQAITPEGEPVAAFGQVGDASGDLAFPKSVSVDPDGHVWVLDGRFENVQVFDPSGRLLLFFGEEGHQPGQFWLPGDLFFEATGRLWICDSYNKRVQVFQYVGEGGQVAEGPR
ncbi:MAG: hypothetical protein AABZ47_04460 [Planctomycetota bacterium]